MNPERVLLTRTPTARNNPARTRIAIIGAGFGGLGLGARLKQRGEHDFLIFDSAAGVGGTWWFNRYPGCACDVPSQLYSLSFFPNPDWTRRFAPRGEIQSYLERLVAHFGLAGHLRLGTGIRQMQFDENAGDWRLEDEHGQTWRTRFAVSAMGGLSRPKRPDIGGLETFAGDVFHSRNWDESFDPSGRRVAVIGTGASAAQFVPQIAPLAEQLDVYQRSPQWILPRPDAAIGARLRAVYRRLPWLQKTTRFCYWLVSEARVPGLAWSNRLAAFHRLLAHWHRRRQVPDPELRQRLRPDYDIGCKRVILSSDFYPALSRANVELVTNPIERIEPDAIVDSTGNRRPVDTLILGTGFRATEPVPEGMILGRDGIDLAHRWRDGPEAWRGVAVAGFPNLFFVLGPNTALGHNSVLLMIEAQIEFILRALERIQRSRARTIEVRDEAQAAYNRWLHRRLARTVWNSGGCSSWYLHPASGRNTTLWPGFTRTYRRMMRRVPTEFLQSG